MNVILPIAIGGILYYLVEPGALFVRCLDRITGTSFHIKGQAANQPVLKMIRNYGFDFLWAYALTAALCLVIGVERAQQKKLLATAIFMAVIMEALQRFPGYPGTFDVLDIVVECAAEFFALFLIYKVLDRRKEETW